MDDEKIISDRTLDLERQEQDEQARAAKLPPEDRDVDAETGTTLSGDEFPGAVSGDQHDAESMTGPHDDVIEGRTNASMRNVGAVSDDGVESD